MLTGGPARALVVAPTALLVACSLNLDPSLGKPDLAAGAVDASRQDGPADPDAAGGEPDAADQDGGELEGAGQACSVPDQPCPRGAYCAPSGLCKRRCMDEHGCADLPCETNDDCDLADEHCSADLVCTARCRRRRAQPDFSEGPGKSSSASPFVQAMNGAELANLINEAALLAVRRGQVAIHPIDLTDALEKVQLGTARKVVIPPEERRRTAYHEGGHALLGMLQPGADPVRKVSIVPRGRALGVTLSMPEQDRYGYDAEHLRGRMVGALGGMAAEEAVFGVVTTGARATCRSAPASPAPWSVVGACPSGSARSR